VNLAPFGSSQSRQCSMRPHGSLPWRSQPSPRLDG
jgi:hypothetical protein